LEFSNVRVGWYWWKCGWVGWEGGGPFDIGGGGGWAK
jgi:hypothetical protein